MPETRRYYLTSHAGLWRLCRYSLVPTVLANSTQLARNFTTLSTINLTAAHQLRQREATADYVLEAASLDLPAPIADIDNTVKRALFAHWVRNPEGAEFRRLRAAYREVSAREAAAAALLAAQQQIGATTSRATAVRHQQQQMLDPTDVQAIGETLGAAMSPVPVNGTMINVIVPLALRRALFDEWERQPRVLLLLFAFARDMELPVWMVSETGTVRYIIQPPMPPKRGRVANGYEYKRFGECKN